MEWPEGCSTARGAVVGVVAVKTVTGVLGNNLFTGIVATLDCPDFPTTGECGCHPGIPVPA